MCRCMATSLLSKVTNMDQLTFLSEEPHVSPSQSQDLEAAWMTSAGTWPLSFLDLLREQGPPGWFGRTSLASCHRTEEGTLVPFSGAWGNSGMGSPTEHLTLSTSEFHRGADACSLSDILETGDHLSKYSLSAKACKGILRRAEKRGKALPEGLYQALTQVITASREPQDKT